MTSSPSGVLRRRAISSAVAACAFALVVSAHAQSRDDEARRHFRAGADLVRAGDCHGALPEFRASLEAVDSPNTRLLYARCLGDTGDVAAALAEYARTERDAAARAVREDRFASTRTAAHDEAAQLEARAGRLVISYPADAPPEHLTVAGNDVAIADARAGVPMLPGTVTIEARWPGGTSHTYTATLVANTRTELRIAPAGTAPVAGTDADRVPAAEPSPRTDASEATSDRSSVGVSPLVPALIVGGVGVLALAASGGMYGAAWSQYDSNRSACGTACTDDRLATGRTLETGSYVALGVGAALVVAGVVTFIVLRGSRSTARSPVGIRPYSLAVTF